MSVSAEPVGSEPGLTDQLVGEGQRLRAWLQARGEPAYRLHQMRRWLFQGRAESYEGMTDLPARLRQALTRQLPFWTMHVATHRKAADGTEKLLLRASRGGAVECVLLRDGGRRTVCLSTQVGCAMGCVFCASGLDGWQRNLSPGEILEQVLRLQHLLPASERLTHVVAMGMGEPLANLPHLLQALDWIHRPEGLNVSARRVTISTVGLPAGIRRLARHPVPYHLAVSLHAPTDKLRQALVPVARTTPLREVLAAVDAYFEATGRRVTFEYVLLAGVNDGEAEARGLARLLVGRRALVNLIPYNPVDGLPFRTPSRSQVARFRAVLEQSGLTVRIRRRRGETIDAACGQLRRAQYPTRPAVLPAGGPRSGTLDPASG